MGLSCNEALGRFAEEPCSECSFETETEHRRINVPEHVLDQQSTKPRGAD